MIDDIAIAGSSSIFSQGRDKWHMHTKELGKVTRSLNVQSDTVFSASSYKSKRKEKKNAENFLIPLRLL